MRNASVLSALAASVFLTASALVATAAEQDPSRFDTGMIVKPHILVPDKGDISSAVVLISDAAGWGKAEADEATRLADNGAVVIGIDFPSYIASLSKDDGDCIYMVSDIEALSQQVQRAAGNGSYRLPVVAGIGEGGALALAIAAQSPGATIGETLAVDPVAGIPLSRELCTPAEKTVAGNRIIYGLTDGALPDPVTVILTDKAPADGRAHVAALKKSHDDITVTDSDDEAQAAFSDTLDDMLDALSSDDSPLGLPINILEAKPTMDTMAVIYSGDGGWRDLDKETGTALQAHGIPVVGVDSLKYFWSKREPQETADDLSKIIALYRKTWNVKHVLLIGYSFGADVMPATYNRLPAADKALIPQISLLALSRQVDYVVSVMGWLGATGSDGDGDPTEDLKAIDPKLVQCIYGTDEDEDPCPTLKDRGVEVIPIEGGHHFDEDYNALAERIIAGLKERLGT